MEPVEGKLAQSAGGVLRIILYEQPRTTCDRRGNGRPLLYITTAIATTSNACPTSHDRKTHYYYHNTIVRTK